MPPPIKPSQVFFGESFVNGVRPKKKPKMYAMMSLHMINETGKRNQIIPREMFRFRSDRLTTSSTFTNILNHLMTTGNENHQSNVRITKQSKLLQVISFLQTNHKTNESTCVEKKSNHPMIGDQWLKKIISIHQETEIMN